jgi:hypothetical protein
VTGGRSQDGHTAPALSVAALLAFSIVVFARAAAGLPFWYDESLTVRLSRLGLPGELWRALTAGFEFNPPLIYIATKLARLLPGPETLTARLPGLLGYALLVGSLFVFLRRRIGPWFAVSAVGLLPLAEYTIRYAIEARAYMLLLGMSGCALLFWQQTAERRSPFAPAALTLATASALLLHVWAIVLPLALVVGEVVEWARTRSLRWRVVWALAAAAPVLAVYPVLLRASRTVVFGGSAYEPTAAKLYAAVRSDVPRPRVIAAALLAAVLAGWWRRRRGSPGPPSPAHPFDAAEVAVILVLLVSPAIPYLYAATASGAFMTRYAMFGLPAVVSLLGGLLYTLGRGQRIAGQAAAAVTLAGVLVYFPGKVPTTGSQSAIVESLTEAGASLDPSVPLVLVNPVDVIPFDEQADEPTRNRAIFVADPDLALKHTRTNGIDLGYVRGEPYLNLRVRRLSYPALISDYRRLYLVGKWQALTWLPQQLEDDGWTLAHIGGTRQAPVFEALRRE